MLISIHPKYAVSQVVGLSKDKRAIHKARMHTHGLKEPKAPYMQLLAAHITKAPEFAGGYFQVLNVDQKFW